MFIRSQSMDLNISKQKSRKDAAYLVPMPDSDKRVALTI